MRGKKEEGERGLTGKKVEAGVRGNTERERETELMIKKQRRGKQMRGEVLLPNMTDSAVMSISHCGAVRNAQ